MAVSNFYPYSLYAAARIVVTSDPTITLFSSNNVANATLLAENRVLVTLTEGITVDGMMLVALPEAGAVGVNGFTIQSVLDPAITVTSQLVFEIVDALDLGSPPETYTFYLAVFRLGII